MVQISRRANGARGASVPCDDSQMPALTTQRGRGRVLASIVHQACRGWVLVAGLSGEWCERERLTRERGLMWPGRSCVPRATVFSRQQSLGARRQRSVIVVAGGRGQPAGDGSAPRRANAAARSL